MKITIVPAQVTTVEDKVAGNLTLTQLILLVVPVFVSGMLYAIVPPSFGMAVYKVIIVCLLFIIVGSLAIRVHGRLLIYWLIILIKYVRRPQYYIFNKNDGYLRNNYIKKEDKTKLTNVADIPKIVSDDLPPIAIHDRARLEDIMSNPQAKLAFKISRKGGLDVYITEVK